MSLLQSPIQYHVALKRRSNFLKFHNNLLLKSEDGKTAKKLQMQFVL